MEPLKQTKEIRTEIENECKRLGLDAKQLIAAYGVHEGVVRILKNKK